MEVQAAGPSSPEEAKQEALKQVEGWAKGVDAAIRDTPAETISRSRIVDRYGLLLQPYKDADSLPACEFHILWWAWQFQQCAAALCAQSVWLCHQFAAHLTCRSQKIVSGLNPMLAYRLFAAAPFGLEQESFFRFFFNIPIFLILSLFSFLQL